MDPKDNQSKDIETFQAGSGYKFSAMKLDALGSAQYTLVQIVMDVSGSVDPFAKQLETMLKTIFKACNDQNNPYRENLMIRLTTFNQSLTEVHGFKTLNNIKEDDYTGALTCGGNTALVDATDEAMQTVATYGKTLTAGQYTANAIIVVVTDGQDNSSQTPMSQISKSIQKAKNAEVLESIRTILVGVTNDDSNLDHYLQTFKDDAAMDQYVSIGKASPGKIAKLAAFISQSVSSTSSALNTGGPSKPITPTF
jgi:uncharacterized protein YegL